MSDRPFNPFIIPGGIPGAPAPGVPICTATEPDPVIRWCWSETEAPSTADVTQASKAMTTRITPAAWTDVRRCSVTLLSPLVKV